MVVVIKTLSQWYVNFLLLIASQILIDISNITHNNQ